MARSDRIRFQLPVLSAPAIGKPIPVSRYRQTLPPGQQVCSAYPFQARILRCRMPPEAFSPYRMRPRTGPPQSADLHGQRSRFTPMKSLNSPLVEIPVKSETIRSSPMVYQGQKQPPQGSSRMLNGDISPHFRDACLNFTLSQQARIHLGEPPLCPSAAWVAQRSKSASTSLR